MMATKTTAISTEALIAERDRLEAELLRTRARSEAYFTLLAAQAQVEAELVRRELPERERALAEAEARVAEQTPIVRALLAEYEAAKQAVEQGPGAAYRHAQYELNLLKERAGGKHSGARGALAQARGRLQQATQIYHQALADLERAQERRRRQEIAQREAQAERERIDAHGRPRELPPVPPPVLEGGRR